MSFGLILVLILSGLLPSLLWLIYYLRKDCHPEPKSLIAKTLAAGVLMAPLAVIAQYLFSRAAQLFQPGYDPSFSGYFFIWAALVEEYVKYLAVKFAVLNNPEFDEPTDAMIYMISAALGFAAIENVLVLFQTIPNGVSATAQIWFLRFAGATLLHAVSSALLGYFLGLAWFYRQHSRKLIVFGLAAATFAHFVFNIALLTANNQSQGFLYSSQALIILLILISFLFAKLRRRMVC